jgi:ABC-type xylose transport system permease subunit
VLFDEVKQGGPDRHFYTWQFNDQASTFTCRYADYLVTFGADDKTVPVEPVPVEPVPSISDKLGTKSIVAIISSAVLLLIACFLIGYHIRRRNTKEKMAAL